MPRLTPLEPHLAAILPDLVWTRPPNGSPSSPRGCWPRSRRPWSGLAHLHGSAVSVRDEAGVLVKRLRTEHAVTFRSLTAGAERLVTVARFLALLELFRDSLVGFEQVTPLGELTVRWTAGPDDGAKYLDPDAGPSEFDEDDLASVEPPADEAAVPEQVATPEQTAAPEQAAAPDQAQTAQPGPEARA